MKYKIKKLYTENLNVSAFNNFIEDGKIKLNVNFNTDLLKSDNDFILKIYYSINSLENPIYLNWIGVAIIDIENPQKEFDKDVFLLDNQIKEFVNKSVENFSFFMGGELPNLTDILEVNND